MYTTCSRCLEGRRKRAVRGSGRFDCVGEPCSSRKVIVGEEILHFLDRRRMGENVSLEGAWKIRCFMAESIVASIK